MSTTQNTIMKTRAAIAWQAGQPLTIHEVDLAAPRAGEVVVDANHLIAFGQQPLDQEGADEAGAAGDQHPARIVERCRLLHDGFPPRHHRTGARTLRTMPSEQ